MCPVTGSDAGLPVPGNVRRVGGIPCCRAHHVAAVAPAPHGTFLAASPRSQALWRDAVSAGSRRAPPTPAVFAALPRRESAVIARVATLWRIALGWVLVVGGLAALVLPGPGLLALFAGLAILSQHYEWARRRLEPVKIAAIRTAAEGVRDWWRMLLSGLGIATLFAAGVLWLWQPRMPEWWPLGEFWWLPGGWATGVALVVSGFAALALVAYSYRHFRGMSDAQVRAFVHDASNRR
jgi:hypothetical protein